MKGILKKVIIFVVIFILLVVGWSVISGKKTPDQTLTSSEQNQSALLGEDENAVADSFLNTLLNLNAITLDGSLFADPRFASLVDYTVHLIPQPQGRPNPFIPATGGAGTTTTPSGTAPASSATPPPSGAIGN